MSNESGADSNCTRLLFVYVLGTSYPIWAKFIIVRPTDKLAVLWETWIVNANVWPVSPVGIDNGVNTEYVNSAVLIVKEAVAKNIYGVQAQLDRMKVL